MPDLLHIEVAWRRLAQGNLGAWPNYILQTIFGFRASSMTRSADGLVKQNGTRVCAPASMHLRSPPHDIRRPSAGRAVIAAGLTHLLPRSESASGRYR